MVDAVCAGCGTGLSAAAVLYDEQGNIRCERCSINAQVADSQKKVALKVKGIAYGGPVVALVAFVYNPGFIMTVAAIANGIYVLNNVKDASTAKHLTGSIGLIKGVAITGMVLGGLAGVVHLLIAGA
jgi:hypothetical protein